ncbi:extracellular solute-binding protein [Nocardioides anomalus]|uniref:Extracellular solute-binding protein n=1 Tax=Nocardioides anomalus TaxID=2712223 RepID=A0A6G6W8W8_9ACTN|nr:extracellular solute-binding protein [Nocardioides anomalus]QIG41597.1 extracellular solute-binding protein [Nocardioides anomalus]
MRRSRIVVPLALVVAAALAGCTDDEGDPGPVPPTSSQAAGPVSLSFAVWGSGPEVDAYDRAVDAYNTEHPETKVKVKAYGTHSDLLAALEDGGPQPDVFLVSRGDLQQVRERELNRPIGALLDERDVDFGDGYSRVALEAFSGDRDLQCMPYGISPMVIYYNKALVDFPAMAERGLDVPTVDDENLQRRPSWSLEQFQVAADYASRPRKGIGGFYVAPTLRGLAPFVYSGGGEVFDDDQSPTSLSFSSDDTRSALEDVLPVLRDPKLGLTAEQLSQKTPLEWFREGKLGMIAGFRDLVPQLRSTAVDFDIMPMPVVGDAATVGDLTGVCIGARSDAVAEAADFLVDFVSTDAVSTVAAAGYLAPANTQVALSDAFLQPRKRPLHSAVSNNSIRSMRVAPLLEDPAALEDAVAAPLKELLEDEVLDSDTLSALTDQIDEASKAVLSPPDTESPSPDSSESSDSGG